MNETKFEILVQLKNKKGKTFSKNFKPWKNCQHHMDPDGFLDEAFVMKKLRDNDFEEEIGNLTFKKAILVEVDLTARDKFELYLKRETMYNAITSNQRGNGSGNRSREETKSDRFSLDSRDHHDSRDSRSRERKRERKPRKVRPCHKFFDDDTICEYGDRCRFSHDRAVYEEYKSNQKDIQSGSFRSNLKASTKNTSKKDSNSKKKNSNKKKVQFKDPVVTADSDSESDSPKQPAQVIKKKVDKLKQKNKKPVIVDSDSDSDLGLHDSSDSE